MFRWIKKQIDKLPSSPGLVKRGNWYVLYPDKFKSKYMTYDVACSYCKIYGGKVYHISDKEARIEGAPITTIQKTIKNPDKTIKNNDMTDWELTFLTDILPSQRSNERSIGKF